MSARAAWRLETLGFTHVFRYQPGKADWFAAGLPMEGTRANVPRAGDSARRGVPACRLTDRVGEVRDRVRAAGWDVCLVVTEEGVILGRLRGKALDATPEAVAETVMEAGPTTIRPNTPLESIARRMQERQVGSIVVSDSDGRLIGILYREDTERALSEPRVVGTGGSQRADQRRNTA
ncbi:MAG: CBS domain-containing protein [Dehalococcoidia bacterium]